MKKVLTVLSLWLPVIIWMGVIYFFSSFSTIPISKDRVWNFIWYKIAHIIEYAILNMLIFRALWWGGNSRQKGRVVVIAFTFSVLYAISDELHQLFTPTREGKLRDILIDTVGITIGGFLAWKYIPTLQRRQES